MGVKGRGQRYQCFLLPSLPFVSLGIGFFFIFQARQLFHCHHRLDKSNHRRRQSIKSIEFMCVLPLFFRLTFRNFAPTLTRTDKQRYITFVYNTDPSLNVISRD